MVPTATTLTVAMACDIAAMTGAGARGNSDDGTAPRITAATTRTEPPVSRPVSAGRRRCARCIRGFSRASVMCILVREDLNEGVESQAGVPKSVSGVALSPAGVATGSVGAVAFTAAVLFVASPCCPASQSS